MSHRCGFCSGVLNLFKEAVDAGLRFSPEEVRAMVEKSEREMQRNIEQMAARGYVQFPNGNWGWLDPKEIQ